MKKIEVTIEKLQRAVESFEVSDSQYEEIKRTRRIPDDMLDKMKRIVIDSAYEIGYDYAVYSETEQKQLIEWG